MHCPTCSHACDADARFCAQCGAALMRRCAGCNAELTAGSRFCSACGLAVAPVPAPRTYTPKHLADRILATRAALEGERKHVTVLFVDVKSSTALAAAVDLEDWHRILDGFFAVLTEGVHRFEGTINQYTGDGVMALFGAPIAHEDHAQRACFAALHLRTKLAGYAREVKRAHGLGLTMRFGLNSGEVVVGRIGDDLRMDYTAQGQTVNLAQRMESLASPDTIYLTADTAALVAGYFALADLGEFPLKGLETPVRVHELTGLGPAQTRFDRSRTRGLSKFVGREHEMTLLEEALQKSIAGEGQVVGIVAEAGTGKSRLAYEFTERCRARGIAVRVATGVAHGKAVPLLPVLDYYRQIFGIDPHDSDLATRGKIAGGVVSLDESLVSSLPLLYDFFGVPDVGKSLQIAPGEARQRALLALLKRLMLERGRRAPAVVLFEDLHWIDDATALFLENIVDGAAASRTLLVVNFRPEFRADWTARTYYRQLTLAPLDAAAFREMLTAALGDDASLVGLADRIHARAAGNPFFAEEIVQSLLESGLLEGARGRYRLTAPVREISVPATVQAVLAARIDRLGEREKRLLQTAAVIGRDFDRALLARVGELDADALDSALSTLVQSEFLLETALYPEQAYRFKHPQTQDVALGSQLRDRRAQTHAAVARALEATHPERLDEHAALLAQHYEGAGDSRAAARWHARVAEGTGSNDAAEALARWRRVESLLAGEPQDPDVLWLRAAAYDGMVRGGARGYAPLEEIAHLASVGLDLARRAGHRRAEAMILYGRALGGLLHGAARVTFHDSVAQAIALAEAENDVPLLLAVSFIIPPRAAIGDLIAHFDRLILLTGGEPALGADLLQFSPLIGHMWGRARTLRVRGRLVDAEAGLEQSTALLERYQDPFCEQRVLTERVYCALLRGDLNSARRNAERACEIARRGTHRNSLLLTHAALFDVHRAASDWSAAQRVWEDVVALGLGEVADAKRMAARLALERGDAIAASSVFTATDQSPFASLPGAEFEAEVRIRTSDDDAAVTRALDAFAAMIEAEEAELYRPQLHELRAQFARRRGDAAAAARELREALRLYEAMDATGHVERLRNTLETGTTAP